MATAALAHVASLDGAVLWRLDRTGRRGVDNAYDVLAGAGLLDAREAAGKDAVAKLHGVFDVCLANGLASVPIHYLRHVCLDASLASSSPDVTEGRLVDGSVVETWARTAAARAVADADACALGKSVAMADMRAAAAVATRLAGVAAVLDALAAAAGQSVAAEAHASAAAACRWTLAHVDALEAVKAGEWHRGPTTGGYATASGWRAAVEARRQRAASRGEGLFLDSLLEDADQAATSYPPETVEDALRQFMSPPAGRASAPPTAACVASRRALLLYFLADRAAGDAPTVGTAGVAARALVPRAPGGADGAASAYAGLQGDRL